VTLSEPTSQDLDAAVHDRHIASFDPLPRPIDLREEFPADPDRYRTVTRGRAEVEAALKGDDDRMVVVVGPCSIHDRDLAH
jgi:3-deoxy-7-phosphoheptulonate synthase